jgi:hypothetical protein
LSLSSIDESHATYVPPTRVCDLTVKLPFLGLKLRLPASKPAAVQVVVALEVEVFTKLGT